MTSSRSIVIIGGVAAGMSAATRLRRLDESARITVIERGEAVSLATCGMPYAISGIISSRDDLLLQTPERLQERFGLDVRIRTEAVRIDRERQVVVLRTASGTEELAYDDLVLATGAVPRALEVPGAERAIPLRGLDELDRILDAADGAQTAVVVGGGFIGMEVAENLHARGIRTAIVHRGVQLVPALDPEMASPVTDAVRAAGVDVRLGDTVARVELSSVVLASGDELPADLVISAIGVRPASDLARDAGLGIGAHGGVLVDEELRTNDPAIRAVGDVAEKAHAILGGTRSVPLAGPANHHGRLVADALAGREISVAPVLGTAIMGAFGVVIAVVGATETELRGAGIPHRVIHTHPMNHVGYYPGAEMMALKLLVGVADDRILGAQAVGGAGVDRRIDVIATAMRAGITASGLAGLELAYAPQFGSAKDPVNMLGYVAENRRDGEGTIQWHELDDALAAGARLIDVRGAAQLDEGTIPGAEWIPVEQLRSRIDELREGPVVVHCRVGQGAHTAMKLLEAHGVDAVNLDGGYLTWRAAQRVGLTTFEKETTR
ncbi:FAD-dependent oxidoreductase [Salinibacterium sp. ZJ70]|uniref:FAD-dependent oxidoreductase n=1 Tax=Salinibacterium sp. ZJ70 TaxID=2708084 RepID=UPI00141EE44A|nr:FAD-dependent oxidoreductase [Salinibacterium sp. ZJ70]